MRLCQSAVSKVSNKKSAVMTDDEYRFLDSIMTPYYCRRVEFQAKRAQGMTLQLVEKSETTVTFKIWVEHVDDQSSGDEDDSSDCSDNDCDEDVLRTEPLVLTSH